MFFWTFLCLDLVGFFTAGQPGRLYEGNSNLLWCYYYSTSSNLRFLQPANQDGSMKVIQTCKSFVIHKMDVSIVLFLQQQGHSFQGVVPIVAACFHQGRAAWNRPHESMLHAHTQKEGLGVFASALMRTQGRVALYHKHCITGTTNAWWLN